MLPFATTNEGSVAWVSNQDDKFSDRIAPSALAVEGTVRLSEFQSCRIDSATLPLPDGFAGGFGSATIPKTSHSLNKIEVRATNWGRVAFTHFRPGGAVAKSYRQVEQRGNLASDYIVSGAHLIHSKRDCVLAVMNIEFEDENTGAPTVQLFGPIGPPAASASSRTSPMLAQAGTYYSPNSSPEPKANADPSPSLCA